jgi:hypothetical protein
LDPFARDPANIEVNVDPVRYIFDRTINEWDLATTIREVVPRRIREESHIIQGWLIHLHDPDEVYSDIQTNIGANDDGNILYIDFDISDFVYDELEICIGEHTGLPQDVHLGWFA